MHQSTFRTPRTREQSSDDKCILLSTIHFNSQNIMLGILKHLCNLITHLQTKMTLPVLKTDNEKREAVLQFNLTHFMVDDVVTAPQCVDWRCVTIDLEDGSYEAASMRKCKQSNKLLPQAAVDWSSKPVPFVEMWRHHPDARRYKSVGVYPPQATCPPDFYNLWTPQTNTTQVPIVTHELIDQALTLLPEDINLTTYGNTWAPGSLTEDHEAATWNIQYLQDAVRDIPYVFCQQTKFNRGSTSYGLKHELERWRSKRGVQSDRGSYIANGEFIVALLILGYKCSFVNTTTKQNSVNAQFNIKRVAYCASDLLR